MECVTFIRKNKETHWFLCFFCVFTQIVCWEFCRKQHNKYSDKFYNYKYIKNIRHSIKALNTQGNVGGISID